METELEKRKRWRQTGLNMERDTKKKDGEMRLET